MLVAGAANGARPPRAEWTRLAGRLLERTLQHLLGPGEPIHSALEAALTEAARVGPPASSEEPLSIWLQRIAVGVAQRHLDTAPRSGECSEERAGGVRELLRRVYSVLSAAPAEERLAFALVELGGRSLGEAGAVFELPPNVLEQRVCRARRRLLFAARRDALLLRWLSIAARWRALSRKADRPGLDTGWLLAPQP